MILPVSSVEILQVFWRRFLQHNSGVPIHPFISVWRGYYHTHNSGVSIHPFISVYSRGLKLKLPGGHWRKSLAEVGPQVLKYFLKRVFSIKKKKLFQFYQYLLLTVHQQFNILKVHKQNINKFL